MPLKNLIQPIKAGIGSTDIDLPVKKCTTHALATAIYLPVKKPVGTIMTVIGVISFRGSRSLA